MHLLIVDDNATNLKLLHAQLEAEGHSIVEAANGVEALQALGRESVDGVVSDILMPEMDGFRLCLEIRKNHDLCTLPFIFYTSTYSSPQDKELAITVGADAYLTKPSPTADILGALQDASDTAAHRIATSAAPQDETYVLKQYSQALVQKLEERNTEVEDGLKNLQFAHDRVQDSEERFRQMAENIRDVFFLIDLKTGGILYISPAYEEVWGRSCDSLYADSQSWVSAIHPEDRDRVLRMFGEQATTGRFDGEYRIVRPDGTVRWIHARSYAIRDESGNLSRSTGVAEDISERKRADEVLHERAQLAALGADVGIALTHGETLEAMLQLCCEAIVKHLHAAFARIWTVNEREDVLELQASAGMYVHLDGPHGRVPIGKFKIGLIAQERKPHLTNQVVGDPRVGDQEWAKREGMVAFAGYPLLVEDHVVGVVAMFARHTLPEVTLQGLASVSNSIALGIERKRNEQALRNSESRLDLALDASGFAVWEWNLATGDVRFSRHWWPILAYGPDEIPLRVDAWESLTHPEDLVRVRSALAMVAKEMVALLDVEYRMRAKSGEWRWIRSVGQVVERDEARRAVRITGTHGDITERKQHEQRIARLSRIQAVLSGINSAIVRIRDRKQLFDEACLIAVKHGGFSIGWIAKLDHATGTLVPIAQAGLPLDFGAGGDASNGPVGLVPGGTAEVALRDKRPAFDNDIERGLREMGSEVGSDTLSIRRAAIGLGAKSVIVLPLLVEEQMFGILTLYAPERDFFDDEEIKLLTELAGDVSFGLEFIAKEEKVDYLAYYDALTGLPNRSLFFDRLTHQLGTAARDGLNVALVLMDVDRFRLINETLGQQAGDVLLKAVAQRIRDNFRDQDTVARVGADSFAVAVSGSWQARDTARFLELHNDQLFGKPFLLGKEELRVSSTSGVAVFPTDGNNPELLYANAEAALKKAKASGERLLFYAPEMNASVADSLRLENRLRQALDNGEMVLWYQPKVSVRTRAILGFEALMRWQDPETGMVPPAKFIPLMEQTGLILDAGHWAMLQVARDCKRWAADGFKPPRVAVNVSPIQLRQKDFVATVVEAAQRTEEAGSMLDIEITESVIMENVETIIPKLRTIRGLGVEIAVDDFGTGYSSLTYIARLPIHDLKIDRSFIVGMTQNADSLTIVRSVISLAHSLRLNVVAEGVETEEQAALLLELGCDEMQGYLISKPVAPGQVPELLRRQIHSATANPPRKISATTKASRDGKKKAKRRSP